jgi:hypothetical protein
VSPVIECIECAAVTSVCERGWRAYLTDEETEPAYAVVLCPACSEREFGDSRAHEQADDGC